MAIGKLRLMVEAWSSKLRGNQQNQFILLAVAVNLALIFLPFYDSNNIPGTISTVAHFNSNVPALSANNWVGGFFITAIFVPSYLAYVVSGFQFYWAFTVDKVIYFALTAGMAIVLYRMLLPNGRQTATKAAFFTLVNPGWLFVNYIWVEFDVFPVFFFLLSYYLLRYVRVSTNDHLNTVYSLVPFMVSVFFYWFPLVALPSLIYFSRRAKARTLLLTYSVVLFAALMVVNIYLFNAGYSHYVSTLLGAPGALNRSNFFGFQYFVKLSTTEFGVWLVFLAFVIPFLLFRRGVSEPATIFVVLLLFIYTSPAQIADNYLWIFPFAVLMVVSASPRIVSVRRLFLAIIYPLVALVLVNLLINNNQPNGVGLFYWGYDVFHANVRFLNSPSSLTAFFLWFNILTTAAVGLSLATAFLLERSRLRGEAIRLEDFPTPSSMSASIPKVSERARRLGSWRVGRTRGTLFVVFALMVPLSLYFNATLPNIVDYRGSGDAPLYVLMPLFVPDNGNVPRPIPNETFTATGPIALIYNNSPPMAFGKWFYAKNINLSMDMTLFGSPPYDTPIISSWPFSLSLLSIPTVDAAGAQPVSPSFEGGVHQSNYPYPLMNVARDVYGFYGNSSVIYNFSGSSLLGNYLDFSFNLTAASQFPIELFQLRSAQSNATMMIYSSYAVLTYSSPLTGGMPVTANVSVSSSPGEWEYLVLSPRSSGLWLNLDGAVISTNALFGSGPVTLSISDTAGGKIGIHSVTGGVSGLYIEKAAPPPVSYYVLELYGQSSSDFIPLQSRSFHYAVNSTLYRTAVTVQGQNFTLPQPTVSFYYGKLTRGSYGVLINLNLFRTFQVRSNNYYLVPVLWSTVVPYILLVLAFRPTRPARPAAAGFSSPSVTLGPGNLREQHGNTTGGIRKDQSPPGAPTLGPVDRRSSLPPGSTVPVSPLLETSPPRSAIA